MISTALLNVSHACLISITGNNNYILHFGQGENINNDMTLIINIFSPTVTIDVIFWELIVAAD